MGHCTVTLTMTDLFCGAGGSSTGALEVPGVEIAMAANHWQLAIETHNANHPETRHDCADISQVDPRRYPRTDILWASPECTNHSQARGKRREDDAQPDLFGEALPDEAAERSRATMWDVPRFAEHHRYRAVIVENVVDAAKWAPFKAWTMAMDSLGYDHQVVYLNSMHAQAGGLPAPQSRDRMYVVFHRRGGRRPDVQRWTRPKAWCSTCKVEVSALQAWKRHDSAWGRYRAQYVYRCPSVTCRHSVVEPAWLPAASAIDWTLPAVRIGDRAKPLSPKTMARITEGLRRHGGALAVPVEGRQGKTAAPVTEPLRTMTARNETALVIPLRANNTVKRTADPFDTVAAAGNHHALLMRHMVVDYNGPARTPAEPFPTVTTVQGDALATVAAVAEDCHFRMFEPYEIARAMAFPPDYLMLGNKRERVRLAGNAVTPPAARDLIAAVAESLGVAL